jgi:BirA family biotin operon repressor/biotin-[acetyl-CoA-carboxylase] ligase
MAWRRPLHPRSSSPPDATALIELVAETGSTNSDLAARINGGETVGEEHWLVADRQTAGRGRQGRAWCDGAGNFMGSTLVHLRAGDPPPPTLSLIAGLAVVMAIEELAPGLVEVSLKWPNDVLLGDAKLAGILLERAGDVVVAGIGVNLVQAPEVPGRAVASLAGVGHHVPRDDFAGVLAQVWQSLLQRWRQASWDELRREWVVRAHAIGTPLQVHGAAGEPLRGTFAGIDSQGALQLQLPGGTRRTIHAGEVLLDGR